MPDEHESLLGELSKQWHLLRGDVAEMAAARWQLAKLETLAAIASARRFTWGLAAAGVLSVASLPVLVVALADVCDGWLGLSRTAWLTVFGLMLASGGALAGWWSWRRFRREFTGLEATLAELREDCRWLEEHLNRGEQAPK